MSKELYAIHDEIGQIGVQLAGEKVRAIGIFAKKYPEVIKLAVGKINAYSIANNEEPIHWIPEPL